MDISSLTKIPVVTGKSSTSVPVNTTQSTGQAAAKPEVATPDVPSNTANTVGTKSSGVISGEPLANAYVVSDQRFTIFKDSLGYVTKYTSLVDGRVTYIPDQDLARFLEAQRQARIDIDA